MPRLVEYADGSGILGIEAFQKCQCRVLHVGFDVAPFAVDCIKLLGNRPGAAFVVGGQAFDAERHVGQAAGRIQAWTKCKAQIERRCASCFTTRGAKQCRDARLHAAGAHAFQALRDQYAIVGVELDDVGYGAESHEVEQCIEFWLGLRIEDAAPAHFGA